MTPCCVSPLRLGTLVYYGDEAAGGGEAEEQEVPTIPHHKHTHNVYTVWQVGLEHETLVHTQLPGSVELRSY